MAEMDDEDVDARFESIVRSLKEPPAWREGTDAPEDDGDFEPAPVDLPPAEDVGYWGAVLALVAGAGGLLWVALVRPWDSGFWLVVSACLIAVGFALVVVRLPRDREDDEDAGARL